MSPMVRSVVASETVKVSVVLAPAARVVTGLVISTLGGVVSMVNGVIDVDVVVPLVVTLSTGV